MFEINQIVYSVTMGKGKVIGTRSFPYKEIDGAEPTTSGLIQMFEVEFEGIKKSFWYFWDGRKNYYDKYPELYSVKVKIVKSTPKPKEEKNNNFIL
jgi:hypothetical protein